MLSENIGRVVLSQLLISWTRWSPDRPIVTDLFCKTSEIFKVNVDLIFQAGEVLTIPKYPRKAPFKTDALEAPLENATLPKFGFAGGATRPGTNPLIVQLNCSLLIGAQDVLKLHIGKTAVGSMTKR